MSEQEEEVLIYGPGAEPAPQPPPESGPGFLERVNPLLLWALAPILFGTAVFLLWFFIPSRRSEIAKGAERTEARVRLKDSQPTGDGRILYIVTFIYPDREKKNHEATNYLMDEGEWQGLKPDGFIKVRFVPGQPGMAFMDNAQAIALDTGGGGKRVINLLPPNVKALSFLGWTLFWLSLPLFAMAYIASKIERKPKPKGPKVVLTRR